MTLPASFPLTMLQIATECGVSLPFSLEAARVPLGLAASGPISFADCLGKSATPGGLVLSPAPNDLYETRSGAGSITSGAATGGVTGGTPGYTQLWTYVSGDSFTINSPTATSTTFTTTLSNGQLKAGIYRLTFTDAAFATISADISVTLESFDI